MRIDDQLKYLACDLIALRRFTGRPRTFFYALLDMGCFIIVMYRLIRSWRMSRLDLPLMRGIIERIWELFSRTHLPSGADIGPGLVLVHGHGIVINGEAKIGANVIIYHRVTLGVRFPGDGSPLVEDRCVIGCGAAILGPVRLPAGTTVPANAVVTPRTMGSVLKVGA